jgi:NADPH:quinone reductase-like Zn-dependent oxidoreductase
MPTMKSVQTAAPGTVEMAEIERPVPGPRDVLVQVRACGICGTDAAFVQMGGMPLGPEGQTTAIPLGHEPAGEIAEARAEVTGLKAGDRVVVNSQPAPSGIIGCGGALGAMREYLLIENAVTGQTGPVVFGWTRFVAIYLRVSGRRRSWTAYLPRTSVVGGLSGQSSRTAQRAGPGSRRGEPCERPLWQVQP